MDVGTFDDDDEEPSLVASWMRPQPEVMLSCCAALFSPHSQTAAGEWVVLDMDASDGDRGQGRGSGGEEGSLCSSETRASSRAHRRLAGTRSSPPSCRGCSSCLGSVCGGAST
eukprot:2840887-Rhodomonas_salina.2